MICHGNSDDHCCYVAKEVCPHLEENTVEGRRWACGLLGQYGSWDRVHTSVEYLTNVKPVWDQYGVVDCGDWTGANRDGKGKAQCCFAETEVVIS